MNWLLWSVLGVVLTLVGLIGIVVLIGLALPQGHSATSAARIEAPPSEVWEALTDFAQMPEWRSEV